MTDYGVCPLVEATVFDMGSIAFLLACERKKGKSHDLTSVDLCQGLFPPSLEITFEHLPYYYLYIGSLFSRLDWGGGC